MNNTLFFDFKVNKQTNSIEITREFTAGLESVWDAWTKAEILDQWWAPKPYRTETKSLDLREGGRWLYAMISPEEEKHWCKADYQAITVRKSLVWLDAFCDESGNENSEKPRSHWTINFSRGNGSTTVHVVLQHDSLADMEAMIQMGFKEGFTMAMGNLDELLKS